MKKIKIRSGIICILVTLLTGCSQPFIVDKEPLIEELPGLNENLEDDAARYCYMNYMYNKQAGEALNTQMLQGKLYTAYPEKIQQIVNNLLRFPLQDNISNTRSKADIDNAGETPWWESLPETVGNYMTDKGIEIISAGLIKFFESDEGQNLLNDQLTNSQEIIKELIKYTLNALEEQFEDEITTLLVCGGFAALSSGVTAGTAIYAAAFTKVGLAVNPLSPVIAAASMVVGYIQNCQN